MASSLLDLAGAKQQVNVTTTENDGEMALYVDAAVDLVEGLIGPVDQRPSTQTIAEGGTGPWLLTTSPVTAVTAATAAGSAVELSALQLDATSAILRATRPLEGPVVVTLTVGRYAAGAVPPAAMRLATRTIFAHLWATQRGSGSRSRGGADDDVALGGMAWAVPNRAADLLRPWLLAPALA